MQNVGEIDLMFPPSSQTVTCRKTKVILSYLTSSHLTSDTNGHLPENKSYLKLSYLFSPWQSRVPVATERVERCGARIYTESC